MPLLALEFIEQHFRGPDMIRSSLVIIVLVAGCASGKQQCVGSACHEYSNDDMATGSGSVAPGPDMTAVPMPDLAQATPPDMTKLLPFGSPCMMNQQCDSGICLQTNNGGVCTQICGDCPTGYGCYGVDGAVQPGTMTNVCVPENNLLCTPCSQATDCGATNGADHCLPYTTGTFCGRDCTTIGCPPTYNCVAMDGGDMGMLHQCVPSNNACDCSATSNGRVISCTIKTQFGTMCPGSSTCTAATGWGTCTAPSMDDTPDDNFTDSNCDGIDGNIEAAVFVDGINGNDSNSGSIFKPVATIAQGIALAKTQMLTQVYISKGTYNAITLANGISLYGGYDASNKWQRSYSNIATITNGVPAIDAQFISKETHVELLTVVGGTQTGFAGNSYGVRVANSSGLILHKCSITSSDAGGGSTGYNGQHGLGKDNNPSNLKYDGMAGNINANGTSNYGRGGDGGQSYCSAAGGHGGYGVNAANGGAGDHGYGVQQVGGGGGGPSCNADDTNLCSCGHSSAPGSGNPGASGAAGADGISAAQIGSVASNNYTPANGSQGNNGIDGSGGSGGGAGGGSTANGFADVCDTDEGGGGGGGGAGGCHGLLGGGGGGGGASFAVFAVSSTLSVDQCVLASGTGGPGGHGGNGGVGGAGGGAGGGGAGTTDDGDGQPGANGGTGGKGGAGGSGSGGTGGPSAGIGEFNSNISSTHNTFNVGSGGSQGIGGNNGVSAASNGYNGQSGSLVSLF
jgi:hypothetical protein